TYHGVFWLTAGMCLLGALGIAIAEPVMPAPEALSLKDTLRAAAERRIVAVLAVTLLACLSTFAVYTYTALFLDARAGVHGHATVLLPLVGSAIYLGMGLGAMVGGLIITWAGPNLLGPIASLGSALAVVVLLTRANRPAPVSPAGKPDNTSTDTARIATTTNR